MSYAYPDVLVDTEWVADNISNKDIRIIEVDYDPKSAYDKGHVQGAVLMRWKDEINNAATRDILGMEKFEQLMSRHGVTSDTIIVLYGDYNNWFATFALWVFKIYGHKDVRIMNGGRTKWELEERKYVTDIPELPSTKYNVSVYEPEIRALRRDVLESLNDDSTSMVDVRSPPEFEGLIYAPEEFKSEGAQRAGHIPGAVNIPWVQAINEKDGTFKSPKELRALYESKGIIPEKNIVTYCRIGERSSHTWVVLKYLLGYPNVSNYDGSWSEWGNTIGAPVER